MYKATMDEVIVSKKQVDIPSPIQISWIVMFGGQYLILAPHNSSGHNLDSKLSDYISFLSFSSNK